MIDFIKINNLEKSSSIPSIIDFDLAVNSRTGEEYLDRKRSACLKNLEFTLLPCGNIIKMQGSIHKYANNGENNHDRFSIERFKEVAETLAEFISPKDRINVIEFGVNIKTPFEPSVLIRNLIAYAKKPLVSGIFANETYAQARSSQYLIKLYDKGVQQGLPGSKILRVEVKYFKMENLFKEGLTWDELQCRHTWEYLGQNLKKKVSDIVYYDPSIDFEKIPKKEAEFLKMGNNPFFWRDLTGTHVSRTRREYKGLVNQYGCLFSQLDELIDSEIKELVKSDQFSPTQKDGALIGLSFFNNSVRKDELVNSDPLLLSHILPTKENDGIKKVCTVTGIDISMQKEESRFLCYTGIRYLYNHDRDQYYKLLSELPEKWHNASREVQEYKIAHQVRDKFFNPRNRIRRAIKRLDAEPTLFDNRLLISKEKMAIAETP